MRNSFNPSSFTPQGHRRLRFLFALGLSGLGLVAACGPAARASDLRIRQQGKLNVYTSVQNDQNNRLNLQQRGGDNIGVASQYGVSNTAINHGHARINTYRVSQFGLANYSQSTQIGHQNNAFVEQGTQVVSGLSGGNGPQVTISQTSHDGDSLSFQQFVDHGIMNFATVYHSGGVNILSITPYSPNIGVMGRAH